MVRVPSDLAEKIDEVRGGIPRERFVRDVLTEYVERALQSVLGCDKGVTQMHVHEARRRALDPAVPITITEAF